MQNIFSNRALAAANERSICHPHIGFKQKNTAIRTHDPREFQRAIRWISHAQISPTRRDRRRQLNIGVIERRRGIHRTL